MPLQFRQSYGDSGETSCVTPSQRSVRSAVFQADRKFIAGKKRLTIFGFERLRLCCHQTARRYLIVCDQSAPAVDVIAPPYTSITRTLGSGYEDPFHVTIDAAGNHAYVTDFAARVVQVLNYPSGTIAATLGSANGLDERAGAVDSKNRVVAP